jgi:SAM-dependent methyltransferase
MPATGTTAIWHEVECAGYSADLELWDRLAREAAGPVLELGCGSGRVALRLARQGHDVTGVDRDRELVAELRRRAGAAGVAVEAVVGDARDLELGRRFALVLAPMQLVHLLAGAAGRGAMLAAAARHLAPSGALAVSVLADGVLALDGEGAAVPDVRQRDGWVYSSLPVRIRDVDGAIEVRRLRQAVSPAGDLEEELDVVRLDPIAVDTLVAEAAATGLRLRERLEVAPTADHVGSSVPVFEPGPGS